MRGLHPVLLLGVIHDEDFEDIECFTEIIAVKVDKPSKVVPLLFRHPARGFFTINSNLDVREALIVFLELEIAICQQYIRVCAGCVRHRHPSIQRVDALLPVLLQEIELRNRVERIDLKRERNLRPLINDFLVVIQRAIVVFDCIAKIRIRVVNVS